MSDASGSRAAPVRRPNILDVVRGVTAVAPAHPEVSGWWYAPGGRFVLEGESHEAEVSPLEIVVEVRPAATADSDTIAGELSKCLWGTPIAVRSHRGAAAEGQLYRLLTAPPETGADQDGGDPGPGMRDDHPDQGT